MRTSTITETKNRFSSLIDRVRHGETILILDRKVPVARLEPADTHLQSDDTDHISQLERSGLLRRGSGVLPKGFLERRLPRLAKGASGVKNLLTEREDGR